MAPSQCVLNSICENRISLVNPTMASQESITLPGGGIAILYIINGRHEYAEESKRDFLVFLEKLEYPQSLTWIRKWAAVAALSSATLCVAAGSSIAVFAESGVSKQFHVSKEVSILGISLFVQGLAIGPLLLAPLSEVYGRIAVYRVSYGLFFALTWPVSFAPNIAVYLIFRFFTGFVSSSFLTVAGGSVSDLYSDITVATPMAIYTMCPFMGPIVGPLLSGFINQHLDWRWTYHILAIWIFGQYVALLFLVPETFVPILVKRKAVRLRRDTGDSRYYAPIEREGSKNMAQEILTSCYRPFQLLLFDHMALLLDTWTSLILGIQYLTFQAFPIIFQGTHGFSIQLTGLTYLGMGVGMLLALCTQPYWNRVYARAASENGGKVPPEDRLRMGEVGAILVPFGLFWLAFTTYRSVPWIIPIIASAPFGGGLYLVFTSTFTYLVTAYRPIAASAMAANAFMRCSFAAAFPLFAGQMYERLGTVGATALLAGLTAVMAPLPFIYRRIGKGLRAKSRFAERP
ncbi:MFS general substrate transporter [Coprinopsis marcescibilis]|uniref:MFS general substrate transporter n=1 Tax=Coprinopsis marcescibilis TaxID=230819 RepID=A0A5C3KU52_COPMA|nr:MFS general substrate transporter [Coprinopsis marcescibilis]